MALPAARIVTFQSEKNLQWYNRVEAKNGRILVISEGFPNRSTAEDNISALEEAMLEILEAKGLTEAKQR